MSSTSGSSTVDQRIVEMRIDNDKFEAGAKKTIGILESLDRSLKNVGQDNVTGFDNIEKSLDKVTNRFSAMGIVGDQVMRNLTNKAIELVGQFKNITTMLTTQQIGAGWNKYADKTQSIQTIMAATNKTIEEGRFADQAEQLEWVNEQIEKLNKFTDETSYNFLDMVGNIGKFTAAGRELEESVTAMEGIANWAAISGGRPAEASRAMYNLSQALGMGAVTTIDWKSIENANMATYEFKQQAIDTAVELGRLKKVADGLWETTEGGFEVTIENFRNSLSFGRGTDAIKWFDSDVLLSVLNRYGEFSDILLQVTNDLDLTATEYLKWLKYYKDSDGDIRKLQKEFDLTDEKIEALLPSLQELSKAEYDLGFRAFQAAQEAKTFTEAIDATKDAVSTKWMDVFELLFGNYLEAKELWTQMAEVFWDIFASPVDHLIDIIKGAGGIFDKDGILHSFAEGLGETAGGTAVLEDRLSAVGKTMDDFHKALNKALGPKEVKRIVDDYGSLEEALVNGAITSEQFKKALGDLDDAYDTKSTVSLNRALNKAGKSMTDFKKTIEKTGDAAALDLIENFGGVEEALKRGGISAELFKKALESLGIDAENVSENVEESAVAAVASLEEMRKYALEVLRGDHGNGDERLAWYESMGLDPELMQAMAGDLKNFGYEISDEALMGYMEQYYQYNNLAARLGYETFAEYMASIVSSAEEMVYDMNQMADEADDIYASLFGEGVLDGAGDYVSAGELFRKSLSNLLEALDNFGTAFDKAFLKVFGGEGEYDDQISRLSDGFFTLTAAFYSFSERVKAFSESETFMNFMMAFFSTIRVIGKALGVIFKVTKIGLSFVLKFLSPILKLATGLFEIVSTGLDALSRSLDDLGIIEVINKVGDDLLEKISKPIEKINYVLDKLIAAFKAGFENGGIEEGLRSVYETMQILFQNHPAFLTAVRAIGKVFLFLKDVISGLALAFGGVIGGAVMLVISLFSKLGEWFSQFVTWAQSSELISGIWQTITATFEKFGNVIKRVIGYAEKGYQEGGFIGALTAVLDSFERGVTRLVPGGERLVAIFDAITESLGKIFKRKKSDDLGSFGEAESDVLRLEETVASTSEGLTRLAVSAEGILPKVERAANAIETVAEGAFGTEEEKESFKDKVAGFIQTLWDGILKGLSQIKISDVIGALRLSLIASIATSVLSAITVFKDIGRAVKSIPATFNEIGERFGNMLRSLSASFTANAVLKFAASAILIAIALGKLAKIPQDDLTHAGTVLISILAVLAVLAKYISKANFWNFKSLVQLPNMTGVLIGLSNLIISLTIAAVALTLVQNFGVGKFRRAAVTIAALLAVIGGIVMAIVWFSQLYNAEKIKAMSRMMLAVGAAMTLIGIAVRKLAMSVIMLSLVQNFGVGKFRRAVFYVGALLAALVIGVGNIMLWAEHLDEKELLAMGRLFLRIAAALVIVAFAVQMMTIPIVTLSLIQSTGGKIGPAVLAIIAIIAAVALLVKKLTVTLAKVGYSNMEQIGKTMLRIAASLVIASVAMNLMMMPIKTMANLCEKMNEWDILTGVLMLLGTVAAIGMLLTHWNKTGGMNGGEGMIKVAGAITMIALAMLFLTPAVIALSAAIGIFAGIFAGFDDETWSKFAKGLWRVVKLSGAIAVFGLALIVLGTGTTFAGAGIVTIAGGIFLLVAALAVLMLALPKFIEMLKDLKNTSGEELRASMKKVGAVLMTMTAAVIILSLVLGKLFSFLGAGNLKTIGSGLTAFFKGIVSGVLSGTTNGFTKLLEKLRDPKNRQAIITAIEAIVVLAAAYIADLIPTFTHVIVGGMVTLIDSIATEISSQGGQLVDSLTKLVKAIVGIITDLIAKFFGEESWEEMDWWKKGLTHIGGLLIALMRIAGALKLANPFKDMVSAITGAKGAVSAVKSVGSVASQVDEAMLALSGSSAGYFSSLLPLLGSIAAAAVVVGGAVLYAKKNLDDQQNILGDRAFDGQEKSLEGYNAAIADTEKRMAELKEAMDNGATEFTLVQEYDALVTLLGTLKEEREELQKQTAAAEEASIAISENNNVLGTAAEQSEKFAARSRQATAELKETAAAAEETSGLYERFKESFSGMDFSSLFGDSDPFAFLKEAVANQGIDINDLIKTDGTGFDVERFTSAVNINQLKADLKSKVSSAGIAIPEGLMDGMPEGFHFLDDAMSSMSEYSVNSFLEMFGINSPSKIFAEQSGAIPEGIGLGISDNSDLAVSPLKTLLGEMIIVFDNIGQSFYNGGVSIVQGLVDGISNNMDVAYLTGQNLATSVENGFTEKLSIHSPSRVFANLAKYIPLGVQQGINQEADSAISSVVVLSDALINAIMQSMAMVSTVADEDFEFSPTITPVVDMSNINAAAGSMGSLLGGSYRSYVDGVSNRAANISSAAQSVASERRANNELAFNEMRMMGERIDYLGQAIANMQIVLDTGVLVGATSSRMDNQLGRMAVRKGRGN